MADGTTINGGQASITRIFLKQQKRPIWSSRKFVASSRPCLSTAYRTRSHQRLYPIMLTNGAKVRILGVPLTRASALMSRTIMVLPPSVK